MPLLASALVPQGISSVRIPESVRGVIARLMGSVEGRRLPLGIKCAGFSVLKIVAMRPDSVDAGRQVDVTLGQLAHLDMIDFPQALAAMAPCGSSEEAIR